MSYDDDDDGLYTEFKDWLYEMWTTLEPILSLAAFMFVFMLLFGLLTLMDKCLNAL